VRFRKRSRLWLLLAFNLTTLWGSVADAETIIHLPMNEAEGDVTADVSANRFVGKLYGAEWNVGHEGYGLAFDGSNTYVDVPDCREPCPRKAVTVEAWVNLQRSHGEAICRNGSYLMRLEGHVKACFHVDGKWHDLHGRKPLTLHVWTHLAMTYDSATRTMRIYVNGVPDAEMKLEGLKSYDLDCGSSLLRLGRNTWRASGGMIGRMDELKVSDMALTFKPMAEQTAAKTGPVFVPNGGFEFGRYRWRGNGESNSRLEWELDDTAASHGRWSMKSVAPERRTLITKPIPFHAGPDYVLTVDFKAGSPGRRVTLALGETHYPKRARSQNRSKAFTVGDEWQTVTLRVANTKSWDTGFVFVRISKNEGTLWIDNVCLRPAAQPAQPDSPEDAFGVWFLTRRLGDTYLADSGNQWADVKLVNASGQQRRLHATSRVVDFFGEQSAEVDHGVYQLEEFESKPLAFEVDTGRRGAFRVEFGVTDVATQQTRTMAYRYNVIQPLKGEGDAATSFFGMNTHMEREPNQHLSCNLEMLSQCGVKWIRAWWGWGMAEKQPGKFDWTEYDRQYNLVTDQKMLIMPILLRYYSGYEQAWAGSMDGIQQPPYQMSQWGDFVFQTVSRYRGRVRVWEIWNEPQCLDRFTPETYAELCKVTYTQARRADPACRLVGFAGVGPLEFIRKTVAAGGLKYMDILGEHSYSAMPRPETAMPERAKELTACLSHPNRAIPVWHTEQGAGADGDGYVSGLLTEADCASTLVRAYVCAQSTGVKKFFWFSSQTSPRYGWAVFYEDYVPRPRLIALNGMASQLEGATFRQTVKLGDNAVSHVFERSGGAVAVLWDVDGRTSVTLTTPAPATQIDMMGNSVACYRRGEAIRLSLAKQYPTYLHFVDLPADQAAEALHRAEIKSQAPVSIVSHIVRRGVVEVRVTNRTRQPLDAVVSISADEPMGFAQPQQFVHDLLPEQTRTLLFVRQDAAQGISKDLTVTVQTGAFRLETTQLTVKREP